MGFHHTLFVRQSIEDVDELKKYMYCGGNLRFLAPAAHIADEVGTPAPPFPHQEPTVSPCLNVPLERVAFICDFSDTTGVKARPTPSQVQGGANAPQSQSPAKGSTSARPTLPLQGTYGGGNLRFAPKAHLTTTSSIPSQPSLSGAGGSQGGRQSPCLQGTYGAGVDAERLIDAEHLRSAPPLLRSRGVAGVPTKSAIYAEGVRTCAEGAYDRLSGQAVPLFWAIYIAIHGYEEYAQIGRGYSNFEINEKQKIVATIQNSPTILKQTNQKMTKDKIKEIMSEVMSGKNIGLSTLPAFAVVYNKRIIVVMKNTMRIDIAAEGAEDTVVIRKNNKGMFAPDLDANIGIIERETHCFHQIDKPLRPVSTYKLDELVGIAGLLEVPYENKKKPELYVELVRACI